MGCCHAKTKCITDGIPVDCRPVEKFTTVKSTFFIDKRKHLWKIHKEPIESDALGMFQNNTAVMKMSVHPNLCHPKKVIAHDSHTTIICMQLGERDLFDIISNPFDWSFVHKQLYGIVSGIEHLHKHGRAHRDIKPENIILYRSRLCLVDFDFAYSLNTPAFCGTEYFKCSKEFTASWNCSVSEMARKMDVYAFGKMVLSIFWQASAQKAIGNAHKAIGNARFVFDLFHAEFAESTKHPFSGVPMWTGWMNVAIRCIAKVPPSRIPLYLATEAATTGTKNAVAFETGLEMVQADPTFA